MVIIMILKDRKAKDVICRTLAAACVMCMFIQCLFLTVSADENKTEFPSLDGAEYVYLYNFENDTVLYEKGDLDAPVYPTSTVKLMAGIAAIEALEGDFTKSITITDEMLSHASGNSIGLVAGEVVTAEQMLYAALINSANDAAVVLAYIASGSIDDFVQLMNRKAEELGAHGTVYTNPTGMHDDAMKTTTADTVLIAKYAYTLPKLMEIVGAQKYVMDSTNLSEYRNIYNRNCLISKHYRTDYYYPNAIGMNAGSTAQGGYCTVAAAKNNDGTLTYLCVIMNAKAVETDGVDDLRNYSCAVDLFDWAFDAYSYREILSEKTVICEIPVELSSTADYVTLVPSDSLTVYLASDIDVEKEIKIIPTTTDEILDAPIEKGQVLGQAKVVYGDKELGRVDLTATSDITRSEFLFVLRRIGEITSQRFFIGAIAAAVILSVIYVLVKARIRQRRYRSRVQNVRRRR